MKKCYIVGGAHEYANWMMANQVYSIDSADFIIFTGGEDVTPELYRAEKNPTTMCNPQRDTREIEKFKEARALNLPMVGICRGSQFLCVMAGGELVQNQDNPSFIHKMKTFDGRDIIVTSTHHQAQYPWPLPSEEFRVLGWTTGLSSYHEGENKGSEIVIGFAPNNMEVEICHYPKIRALGIQSHPEMLYSGRQQTPEVKKSLGYMQNLLRNFLNDFKE